MATLDESLEFTDNSTLLNASTFNKLVNRSHVNLLKNGDFESWSNGEGTEPTASTTFIPDGWFFEEGLAASGGGVYKHTSIYACGTGAPSVKKVASNTGVSTLEQNVWDALGDEGFQGQGSTQWVTFSAWVYANKANATRLFVYDGVSLDYSDYYTDTGNWTRISVEKRVSASATCLRVGLYCDQDTLHDIQHLMDGATLVLGRVTASFTPNPLDNALQCIEYDNDGTRTRCTGAMRCVPFKITGTTSGTPTYETETYTLDHGSTAVLAAHANVTAHDSENLRDIVCTCHTFTGTGFTIEWRLIDGSALTDTDDWTIQGFYIAWSWDALDEVHGNW